MSPICSISQGRQKVMSTLSLVSVAVILSGCGSVPAGGASHDATRAAQAVPAATVAPLILTPDIRTCAGVQALIGHIAADTSRWSPNVEPFDKTISARIRELSVNLDKQAPQAGTRHIQAVVHSNAVAFRAVADAMAGKDAKRVSRAIDGTRVAYRELKTVCSLTVGGDQ